MADPFNPNDIYYDPNTVPNYQQGPIALSVPEMPAESLIPLSISTSDQGIPSREYTKKTTEKISIGLGNSIDVSPEAINSLISSGQEDQLRMQIALKQDKDRRETILDNARQLAIMKGSPLTPEEYGAVVDPWNKKTDPSSVIEEAYTKRYINSPLEAYNLSKYHEYLQARKDFAQDQKRIEDVMSNYMNISQELDKWGMKAKAASEQQSYFGDVIDRAKDLSQIYTEWTQRSRLFPESSVFKDGVLLKSNLQEQGTRLFRLPFEDAKKRMESALPEMIANNPFAALQFIQDMKGITSGDVLGQNMFTAMLGAGLVSAPFKAAKFAQYVNRTLYLRKVATDVADNMAKAMNENPFPGAVNSQPTMTTTAAMSEAVGDVESAALRQNEASRANIVAGLKDPAAEAQQNLMSHQRAVTEKLVQGDLGSASRELRARVGEVIDNYLNGFITTWTKALKVDPLGMPLSSEANRNIILQELKGKFIGPNSAINDINFVDFNTNPNLGPNYYHPVTNRPQIRYTIHNYDGTMFADEATARGFAETQVGLVDVNLVEKFGAITSREMARKIARRDFVSKQISNVHDAINTEKQSLAIAETYPAAQGKKRFYTAGDGQLYSSLDEAKSKVTDPSEIRFVDLSSAQIRGAKGVLKEDAKPSGFKTAKGSSYVIQEDGTTIRNKKARPEHPGDSGIKPASAKTVYISQEVANAIAPPKGGKIAFVLHDDGKISLASNVAGNWGMFKGAKELIFSNTPQKGLIPLELWNKSQLRGLDSYSRWHFGNKITDVTFDIKNPGNFNPISYTKKEYADFKVLKGTEGTKHAAAREAIKRHQNVLDKLHTEHERLNADIKQAGEAKYNVQQHGMGFQIIYDRPLPMDNDVIRTLMSRELPTKGPGGETVLGDRFSESTMNTSGLHGLTRGLFGRWMTPNNVLSKEEVRQRIVAESAANYMYDYLKATESYVTDIVRGRRTHDLLTGEKIPAWKWIPRSIYGKVANKRVFREFNEALEYSRTAVNPLDPSKPGKWFDTFGEMDAFYRTQFGRPASEAEHMAYHVQRVMHETQFTSMRIMEMQSMQSRGAEKFRIFTNGADKQRIYSEFFDGIDHDGIPSGSGLILIMGPTKGTEQVVTIGSPTWTSLRPKLIEGHKSGKGRVIQLWNRDRMDLGTFSDVANGKPIQWIYTENGFHRKPLDWDSLKRTEGGHWEYDYSHYIKQAVIRAEGQIQDVVDPNNKSKNRLTYVGDQTFMPIRNRAMGRDVSKILNEARIALKEGDEATARVKLAKSGIDYQSFKAGFFEQTLPDGTKKPASFSLDEPFAVVPKNRKIMDIDSTLEERYKRFGKRPGEADNEFYDSYNKGSPHLEFQDKWNQERSNSPAWTVEDTSWFGKPTYEYRPAEMTSPLVTLNRALNKSVNSLWMNDYKTYAVNHWISEVGPHLDVSPNELRFSPNYYYHIAHDKLFRSAVDEQTKRYYLAARDHQRVFMGTPSATDTYGEMVAQWASDLTYDKIGSKASLLPEALYAAGSKPINFIRAFAFNVKLGLFSPVNFLVQGQTFVNIAALEPKFAIKGNTGLYFYWMARENSSPAVIKALDERAVKMGYRPGEFTEALDMLRQSGWEFVGTSHANAAGTMEREFFRSNAKGVLDAGQAAFRLSEKAPRVSAFFTSYSKWREANPAAKMTEAAKRDILSYADDLTFNMTRASSSKLHTGVLSLTNQFLAYQFRMTELLTSQRLGGTTQERAFKRAQILTAYWAMYGFPSVLNTAFLGVPIGSMYKDYMLSNGYQPGSDQGGNNAAWTVFNEGLVNTAIGFISGLGDMNKGKWLNWGDRLGPQGITPIQEALRTNPDVLKLMGGAGLSVIADVYKGADGLMRTISDMVYPRPGDSRWTMKAQDFIDPLRTVTTVNQIAKAVTAYRTGYWSNKSEGLTEKTSMPWAITQALSGLEPLSQGQLFQMQGISANWSKEVQGILKEASIEWQRALKAASNGDAKGEKEFRDRASYLLNDPRLTEDQRRRFMSNALKGQETLLESARRNFYENRNVPADKQDKLIDVHKGLLQRESGN